MIISYSINLLIEALFCLVKSLHHINHSFTCQRAPCTSFAKFTSKVVVIIEIQCRYQIHPFSSSFFTRQAIAVSVIIRQAFAITIESFSFSSIIIASESFIALWLVAVHNLGSSYFGWKKEAFTSPYCLSLHKYQGEVIFITKSLLSFAIAIITITTLTTIANSTCQLPSKRNEKRTFATASNTPSSRDLQIHHIQYLPSTCVTCLYSLQMVDHHHHKPISSNWALRYAITFDLIYRCWSY